MALPAPVVAARIACRVAELEVLAARTALACALALARRTRMPDPDHPDHPVVEIGPDGWPIPPRPRPRETASDPAPEAWQRPAGPPPRPDDGLSAVEIALRCRRLASAPPKGK